jgi:hypothetical protein
MYKDLITYELAENYSQERLLKVAKDIIDNWMKKLPGFIKWEICLNPDGSYTDIVHWSDKESAKNAEKEMSNIPNAIEWMSCYKPGSISSKELKVLQEF